jgi:hypothetical protein
MTICAISKMSDAHKRGKNIKVAFRSHGTMTYDQRIMFLKGLDRVSRF